MDLAAQTAQHGMGDFMGVRGRARRAGPRRAPPAQASVALADVAHWVSTFEACYAAGRCFG
eukprot:9312810-Pyramimonas_sp.AAC.1